MPVYKNPDFRRLPPGLAGIFARCEQQSFFGLSQWYDVVAQFGVPRGTEIRVYTDERPGSMIAVPLQVSARDGRCCLTSLANFYSLEHGPIAAADADIERGLSAILAQINAERPRWTCLRLAELDPHD